ncbi:hypothetical protein SLS56_011733 [Neofusicoccum ribis]|uniref:PD-(D/E)XK nuclease-like domain-containing protein n=1 Tax=Neofusicoccum ribis TaxID=45134 RepID=A0ABR3SAX9_9PEZI
MHMFLSLLNVDAGNIDSIERDFLVNPRLAAFLTAFAAHGSHCDPLREPDGEFTPNTPMNFFPAKFTALLDQNVQCIFFFSTRKRCEKLVPMAKSEMQQFKQKMDPLGGAVLDVKIRVLVARMLCSQHRAVRVMRAYEEKWADELEDECFVQEAQKRRAETNIEMVLRGRRPASASGSSQESTEREVHSAEDEGSLSSRHEELETDGDRSTTSGVSVGDEDETESASEESLRSGHDRDLDTDEEGTTDMGEELERSSDGSTQQELQTNFPAQSSVDSGALGYKLEPVPVSLQTTEVIETLPSNSRTLVQDLQKNAHRKGIIPRVVMFQAKELLKQGLLMEYHFSETPREAGENRIWGYRQHERFWEELYDVHEQAIKLFNDKNPEPAWNGLHDRVFKLALSPRKSYPNIDYRNITTASTEDSCRAPLQNAFQRGRRVDYALVLACDEEMELRIEEILQQEQELARSRATTSKHKKKRPSINYVGQDHVRKLPITAIIETKKAMGIEDTAFDQLQYCVLAHFVRLRQLMMATKNGDAHDTSKLPTIPLILVYGHEWKFMLAQAMKSRLRIYHGIQIGTTESMVGIYQLMASIRRLSRWLNEVYRPWFMEVVLGMC